MKYRVKVKVSYCETFFSFDDALEACNFMSTAAEHLSGGDKTTIGLTVITEEEEK